MLASTGPTTLPSAKSAYFPASFAGSRQKLFDASHEVCSRQLKDLGKLKDRSKRGTVFTSFQQADVLGVIPALEGKRFLREVALQPQLTEHPRKRSFLWRALFVPSWHPQFGVCGVSINTSTKYSILVTRSSFLGNTLKSCAVEAV